MTAKPSRMPLQGAQKCSATSKRTGKRCGAWAVPGLNVCKWHGGGTAAAQDKAARSLELSSAAAVAHRFGLPIETSPQQALLDEVHRAAGMVAYYGERVAEIELNDPAKLVFGTTQIVDKDGFEDGRAETREAKPNIWLTLWNEERDRLAKVSLAAIKAGIEERRVHLAEVQGLAIAGAIRRVLDRLGLTTQQQALVGVVVPEELRALTMEVL